MPEAPITRIWKAQRNFLINVWRPPRNGQRWRTVSGKNPTEAALPAADAQRPSMDKSRLARCPQKNTDGKNSMENVEIAGKRNLSADRERIMAAVYRLFWIYVVCGVAGFAIETIWCWIDFQEFTSRTSNLFFPISCVWGVG